MLDQYYTRLRTLSKRFADADFEIMLQIVLYGTSSRLRKQALRDPKMTLQGLRVTGRQLEPVNSNTTGTITPMFSSYDWMKPNLKQKARTAQGKWLVRKDWGKLRGEKSLFLSENMLEK